MPTYIYECPDHGEFEEMHKITEIITHCPKCDKEGKETKVKRLICSSSPPILRGSCWAKDNYK